MIRNVHMLITLFFPPIFFQRAYTNLAFRFPIFFSFFFFFKNEV